MDRIKSMEVGDTLKFELPDSRFIGNLKYTLYTKMYGAKYKLSVRGLKMTVTR